MNEIQYKNLAIALKYRIINWYQYFELIKEIKDE